jgi:hypothetical protein
MVLFPIALTYLFIVKSGSLVVLTEVTLTDKI